jgi:hypothetical protein
MANAAARVPHLETPFGHNSLRFPAVTTAQTYYPGAFIGMQTDGYVTKGDDAASLLIVGCFEGSHKRIESGFNAGDYQLELSCTRPRWSVCKVASAAITDVGRLVYAKYDDEVQFTSGTYGNVVGKVARYMSATSVLIEHLWNGTRGLAGAYRLMAATGNQSLTKWDVNKTIIVPNTGALTLTLPAVADTQPGDFLDIIKNNAGAVAITLDGAGAETIDGGATLATMDANYDTARLVSTGTEWVVFCRDIA